MKALDRVRANLRRYIERSGYSMSAVGELSGAGQENLSRFLRGETKMNVDKLDQIADFLHIDIWRLFEPIDTPIPSAALHALNMVSENLPNSDLRVLTLTAQALLDQKKTATTS